MLYSISDLRIRAKEPQPGDYEYEMIIKGSPVQENTEIARIRIVGLKSIQMVLQQIKFTEDEIQVDLI